MDWADIGGKLIRLGAPVIGTALGGPLGGTIGGVLGNVVAEAIGANAATPEAVNDALDRTDTATLQQQLSAADQLVAAKMDAFVKLAEAERDIQVANVQAVNETMRAEHRPDGKIAWWHWRHLLGYAVLAWIAGPLPIILYQMAVGKIEVMNAVIQGLVSLIPLIAIAAGLNGFVARDTTILKQVAMTGEQKPSLTDQITKAILPGRRR